MRAILINSKERTVTEVDYDGNWKSIAPMLECRWFTVVGGLPDGDDLYCDDEGLLTASEDSTYFMMPWYPTPIVGNALILGVNGDGDSVASNNGAEFYQDKFRWMNAEAVWLWQQLHDSSWPSSQVWTLDSPESV